MAEEIDQEVKELVNNAYVQACNILTEQKPNLVRIAEYLIEHEAVSGDDLQRLFNGEEMGGGGDTGTPAVHRKRRPSLPSRPSQTFPPQPAPTLSSQHDQDLGSMPSSGGDN